MIRSDGANRKRRFNKKLYRSRELGCERASAVAWLLNTPVLSLLATAS